MGDRFSLDDIKDLFRDDVQRFLEGMRKQLRQLLSDPHDRTALEQFRGLGHSLKGSAGLVGLTYLSKAGAIMDRVGEVAEGHLQSDPTEALSIFRQAIAALPHVDDLLDNCLAGADPEAQENIYTAFTLSFCERVRRYLYTIDSDTDADQPAAGEEAFDDEFARELAETFQHELTDNLERVPELIRQLAGGHDRRQMFYDLSRIFHTIKGAAAMVGKSHLSELAKYLQDTFGAACDTLAIPTEAVDVVQETLDGIFAVAAMPSPRLSPAAAHPPSPVSISSDMDVDPELLEAFTIDATEAIEASEQLLLELERQPDDRDKLHALFRRFHTLKGAAAAVGLSAVAEQMHHGESLLDGVLDGEIVVDSSQLVDFLFRLTDSVTAAVNQVRGLPDSEHSVIDVAAEVAALTRAGAIGAEIEGTAEDPLPASPSATEPPAAQHAADFDSGMVRLPASRLDTLMNQVTQLVVSRTRMDRKIEACAELRDKLDYCRRRLTDLIQGFQQHYEYSTDRRVPALDGRPDSNDGFFTDLEFDKYDDINILARSVIELATDTGEIADQLERQIDSFAEESRRFSKATSSLQRNITRLRLVPLDTVLRRLVRPVRDAARHEGKLVELQIEGADVQLDKAIVEALHAPLLHLLRNAVSHGIEAPALRQAAGKATSGTIRVTAEPRHNGVQIEVRDDGGGLDYEAILFKARAAGLVAPGVAPSREQLLPLIFRPGFSTGETVTDLAGRGMGMDVVARDIAALNGSVLVDSKDREGTSIRLIVPIMTTIDEVLVLHAGSQRFALAADFVEQAIAVDMSQLIDVDGQPMLQVRNELLPVLLLGALAREAPPSEHGMALLLRSGERAMALVIDRVEPQREAVIRPLGRVLEAHPFLSGATIGGDGSVIFTLHVARLFEILAAEAAHQATFLLNSSTDAGSRPPQAVLIVDDSISVRKLASRFLETEGLEVDTAVDGLAALDKLASGRFRVVVTDLEMPRMHGYELIAEIRRHPDLQHLPVVVCSSRSSEKHRTRARDVGAQGYITKPFTKEQLLAEIARVTGAAEETAAAVLGA